MTVSALQCFGKDIGTDGSSVSSCGWEDPIRDDWADWHLDPDPGLKSPIEGLLALLFSLFLSLSLCLSLSPSPLSTILIAPLKEAEVREASSHKHADYTRAVR